MRASNFFKRVFLEACRQPEFQCSDGERLHHYWHYRLGTGLFAPKDSAFQCPLFMVDVEQLYRGCPSIDDEVFVQEFEKVGRLDFAEIVRNARKSRGVKFSIYTDTYRRKDSESFFAGE